MRAWGGGEEGESLAASQSVAGEESCHCDRWLLRCGGMELVGGIWPNSIAN